MAFPLILQHFLDYCKNGHGDAAQLATVLEVLRAESEAADREHASQLAALQAKLDEVEAKLLEHLSKKHCTCNCNGGSPTTDTDEFDLLYYVQCFNNSLSGRPPTGGETGEDIDPSYPFVASFDDGVDGDEVWDGTDDHEFVSKFEQAMTGTG